ncbi:alkaline phosphatase-like protein [Sistotremastrum suecicum HHB10207 ss-3]|uniref:Alkaline phosphatase-like protein n=1 Tax=Sistotremastrum suecicum HHB10207 ss-3 TaxID=1314776 RepID=A0A166GPJ2_9AGAM|nr:alkaline phosphatase-like protein [Sistotremastrum suecicum HHB10207 ss-3]
MARYATTIVLAILFSLHGIGLWLFTRGFLLTRLSLSEISGCYPLSQCTMEPTHKRAIVLIIDALRFDFVSPTFPSPKSPHHHGVLTLPGELTEKFPDRSFIFNAYSDPPTTTLQRIKGITTGSLPTFVDLGSNFAGSEIDEDSIIRQLRNQDRKVAFMGDDTWMSVFPTSFDPNMTFPYDSFNVEDLHTVDEGVIRHLFPLVTQRDAYQWDFIVGHFLGVDHVGHRLGPSHEAMHAKLKQMDSVLRSLVDKIDDDTLLVVMGDHGMDLRGDHGGDGVHETSSALWIYSKSSALSIPTLESSPSIPSSLLSKTSFPGMPNPHRSVQQIDIVPTLSLLLGLPIPFNNLGAVIPELFIRTDEAPDLLATALHLNGEQVHRYLEAYRASASGAELDGAWEGLEQTFAEASTGAGHALFVRHALIVCRHLWAQFNSILMVLGLSVIVASLVVAWQFFRKLEQLQESEWESWTSMISRRALIAMSFAASLGFGLGTLGPIGISALELTVWLIAAAVSLAVIDFTRPSFDSLPSFPLILILHSISFFSNSFTFWEDRIVLYLALSAIAPNLLTGISAPTPRLRYRVIGFSLSCALCVRLMALSTVCREEQQPYCRVTFYASSSLAAPPLLILILVLPVTLTLPNTVRRFLRISKSDQELAPVFLEYFFRAVWVAGSICWMLEWAETSLIGGEQYASVLRQCRSAISWAAMVSVSFGGLSIWWIFPLCLKVQRQPPTETGGNTQVQIIGFANTFGSPYLIFILLFFSLLYVDTQLTGQVTLSLGLIAFLSWLEIVDSVRDIKSLNAAVAKATSPGNAIESLNTSPGSESTPQFSSELIFPSLLALHTFFATGHQSTFPSIQWKTAFLLTSSKTAFVSPILVILNTFGPHIFFAMASALIASWNVVPLPDPSQSRLVSKNALRVGVGVSAYFVSLLLGSALAAAFLRRHLMVWKVFAPRFMAAAAGVIAVDVGVAIGLLVGLSRVVTVVGRVFGQIGSRR